MSNLDVTLSKKIVEYYKWLETVERVVGDHIVLVSKNPHDRTLERNTDDLKANGYSLKGQKIEISRATGNVFITVDLMTFARWLEQNKETSSE